MSALLKQATVVVVDDEPAVASLFAQYLSSTYRVQSFTSAVQALEHLRQHTADLLVTDLIMPQQNGLDLTGQVKRLHPQIKVLMVSGVNPWAWCQGHDPNLELVDAFLAKPVSLERLKQRCGQLLRDKAPRPESDPVCLRVALSF